MTTVSLWKATELARLKNFIDEETGELDVAGFEAAGIVRLERQRAVAAAIKNLSATVAMVRDAEREMVEKRKSLEAREQRLREYLLETMRAVGITTVSAADGTFVAKVYPERDESVQIDDGATFPPELCRAPPPPEPSKTLIKAAILAGEPVQGARIVRRDRLTIR